MPRLTDVSLGMTVQELMRRASEDSRRLRDVEDRLEILENRFASFEKMLVEKSQRLEERLLHLETDVKSLQEQLAELRASLMRIERISERFATKVELHEIEKMAELLASVRAGGAEESESYKVMKEM